MSTFLTKLREGLKRNLVRDARILVAVSGGADSVALLVGLAELAAEFQLDPIVAHYNHRLRSSASDADAVWVDRLAAECNFPCEIGEPSLGDLAADQSGLEELARSLRYQFLEAVARKHQCDMILLAHSLNDQAETVLHHLLRGSGMAGLRGIPPLRSTPAGHRLIRPMLAITRQEIENYLLERGQGFCNDATNQDLAMTRNRLRHTVLPLLRELVNPQVDLALARLAEQSSDIEVFLRQSAQQLLAKSLLDAQADACRLDVRSLVDQPRHLIREVFRELWQRQQWPQQSMGFDQWNRLADLIELRQAIHLPHRIQARFHAEYLLVVRRG